MVCNRHNHQMSISNFQDIDHSESHLLISLNPLKSPKLNEEPVGMNPVSKHYCYQVTFEKPDGIYTFTINNKNIENLPYGLFAKTGAVALLKAPMPALFSPATRNSYWFPSVRAVAIKVVSVGPVLPTVTQRELKGSFISMTKPVISLPPSDFGFFQVTFMVRAVTSLTSGVGGASGGSGL